MLLMTMAVDGVVRRIVLHRALKVCRHHSHGDGATVGIIDPCHVDGTRWM